MHGLIYVRRRNADAVLSLAGLEASKIELQTVRMETWMNTGTKEEPSFVPLDAIGEAF